MRSFLNLPSPEREMIEVTHIDCDIKSMPHYCLLRGIPYCPSWDPLQRRFPFTLKF